MRVNEHELFFLALKCKPELEATLWHRPPQGMIRQEGFRERLVRLTRNFLFYIRINENGNSLELLGALCLERCILQKEPNSDKGYAFSISYPGEPEKKHYLACPSAQQCENWMVAVKAANCERLRTSLNILQTKLARLKKVPAGRSPMLKRRSQLLPEADKNVSQESQQPSLQSSNQVHTQLSNQVHTQSSGSDGLLIDFS